MDFRILALAWLLPSTALGAPMEPTASNSPNLHGRAMHTAQMNFPSHGLTFCGSPRPQLCTMHYAPVCATQDPGLKSDWKTYSNACMACADPAVRAYRKGTCK